MCTNLINDLASKLRTSVVHHQHNRGDLKRGVQALANQLDIPYQLSNAFKRVVLTLNRDENFSCRNQGIDRQQPERWRTIDEDVVIVINYWRECVDQATFSVEPWDELDLGSSQVQARRGYKEALHIGRRLECVFEWSVTKKHIIHVLLNRSRVDPEAGRSIGLWVQVNEQHSLTHFG